MGEEAVGMMRKVSQSCMRITTGMVDVQQIKLALDPLQILNPDKVIRLEDGY